MQLSRFVLAVLPAARVLFVFAFIFLLLCLYGWTHFFRDPYSIWFDESRALDRIYSKQREHEAYQYNDILRNKVQRNEPLDMAGPEPSFCLAFLTYKRDGGPQYIELAVGSALAGLTPAERHDLNLKLSFTNSDPGIHPMWNTWLAKVVDDQYASVQFASEQDAHHMTDLEKLGDHHSIETKSGMDFAYALKRCVDNSTAPYIGIFEGDILLADGWLVRVLSEIKKSPLSTTTDWMDLRLFSSERSTGWGSRALFGENVPTIIASISGVVLIVALFIRRIQRFCFQRAPSPYLSYPSLFIVCGLFIPATVVLIFQSGKASIQPPPWGIREQYYGCCTQANVFSRHNAALVSDEMLKRAPDRPYDFNLGDISGEFHLRRYALHPVQAQHMGFRSIINPMREMSMMVWSMAFEYLSPDRLARDHETMVKEYYGEEA